jgi:hypothetical protein
MKILSKKDAIVKYAFLPGLITANNKLTPTYTAKVHWVLLADQSLVFELHIFYSVKDTTTNQYVIEYERELQLHCIIDDIIEGAKQIMRIKDEIHFDTGVFLKNNTWDFFDVLNFDPMISRDETREQISIKRAKGTLLVSEMSEEERNLPGNKNRQE